MLCKINFPQPTGGGKFLYRIDEPLELCKEADGKVFKLLHALGKRAIPVSEPSKFRVFLSMLWVKLVFTPGVWFYKLFTGSKMHLMQSDPREKDIISTKQPGYIHDGERYVEK